MLKAERSKMTLIKFFLIAFIIKTANTLALNDNTVRNDKLLNELADKVASYQVLKQHSYIPPFVWQENKGLYKSEIRMNFAGNPLFQQIRTGPLTSVFDNDMFSTGWILTVLLEANIYGKGAPELDKDRLQLALESIGTYNNKNDENFAKSIIRTFWPQVYNETFKDWHQQPINIRNVALNINKIPWDEIIKILKIIKQEKLIKVVEMIKEVGHEAIIAFCIPPDFDDTYLNLGMGASLYKLRSKYSRAYENWLANNTNVEHLVDVTTKYAYRPFDSDINKNLIDPRTFFFARHYIQDAFAESKPLALITTWIQNIDEQRSFRSKNISMPFNLNNVDVTVAANSIYGITSASIYNINSFASYLLGSSDFQKVYLNTTNFISWAIKTNFTGRPDLAQVYYPSTYNFLWYASRTLFLIENEMANYEHLRANAPSENAMFLRLMDALRDILMEAKGYLQDAFENEATHFFEHSVVYTDSSRSKGYFRDFLGLNDTSIFGKPESSDDDALFSTAQAINTLISTWTFQNPQTKHLQWKKQTPENVKQLVLASGKWLEENVFNKKYKTLNAFFSGSVKGFTSLPFLYPTNFVQWLNGTFVDPDKIPESDLSYAILGISGSIDEVTYQKMLLTPHFGVPTPITFDGYNVQDNYFPFWSSDPYTYACALLALSQLNNLV
jgi:hypothetical protein